MYWRIWRTTQGSKLENLDQNFQNSCKQRGSFILCHWVAHVSLSTQFYSLDSVTQMVRSKNHLSAIILCGPPFQRSRLLHSLAFSFPGLESEKLQIPLQLQHSAQAEQDVFAGFWRSEEQKSRFQSFSIFNFSKRRRERCDFWRPSYAGVFFPTIVLSLVSDVSLINPTTQKTMIFKTK